MVIHWWVVYRGPIQHDTSMPSLYIDAKKFFLEFRGREVLYSWTTNSVMFSCAAYLVFWSLTKQAVWWHVFDPHHIIQHELPLQLGSCWLQYLLQVASQTWDKLIWVPTEDEMWISRYLHWSPCKRRSCQATACPSQQMQRSRADQMPTHPLGQGSQ